MAARPGHGSSSAPQATSCRATRRNEQNEWTGAAYRQTLEFWACQSSADECGAHSQCAAGQVCAIADSVRRCTPYNSFPCGTPGRPFFVGDEARVASLVPGTDWCSPLGEAAELDALARTELSRHWREAALLEHASIAAFARFTLQLLQLGAPHDLVLESQRAMLDETEHARRCFSLAARYGGTAEGPGPLPLAGALQAESMATIVRLTFREGCIGETATALHAAEALVHARDREVQSALELISRDELRHATLAWRVVAWALEQDGSGEVREVLHAELRQLRAMGAAAHLVPSGDEAAHHPALAGHGLASTERRRRLQNAAIAELVLPCTERLLGREPSRPPREAWRMPRGRAADVPSRGDGRERLGGFIDVNPGVAVVSAELPGSPIEIDPQDRVSCVVSCVPAGSPEFGSSRTTR